MNNYLELLVALLNRVSVRPDRTGVGTRSIFAPPDLRYDLRLGFPLLTQRLIDFRRVAAEVMWYLRGDDHVRWLRAQGVRWWDPWATEDGWVGPVYGAQWRSWGGRGVDQVAEAEALLRADPTSRRVVVSAWNAEDLPKMALPPCPMAFQLYADGDCLDMKVTQRSADAFLGLPHDIAGHALLLEMFAQSSAFRARWLVMSLGDAHLYESHVEAARALVGRRGYPLPRVRLSARASVLDYEPGDVDVLDYRCGPRLTAEVAV